MTFLRLILVGSSYHQLPLRICRSSATTNYRRRLILFQASGIIRRKYDLKRKLLREQESNGESALKVDKTRAVVKDLHSRIRVAIHRIDSISKKIEDLRDGELQPQLEGLIGGQNLEHIGWDRRKQSIYMFSVQRVLQTNHGGKS